MNFHIFLRRSLKTRVTLFTLIILLMSIWSLAFYISNYLRQDMQRVLSDQQFSTVSILAAEVNDELETRLESLRKTSEQISSITLASPVTLQKSLEQWTIFQALFNGGTFVTGMDGVAIAGVPESIGRIGVSFMDRDYILATLKEGKATISKPVIGKALKTPAFAIATPIRDVEGKVIGALVGAIDLSKHNFLDKITQHHYGKTGGYFLVAPQYRLIVTATDKTRVMQQFPAPGIFPTVDRFLQEDYKGGSSVYVNPLGIEVLGSAKTIPAAGWFMGATLPTAEAFAPIRAMQQRMILSTILVTLTAGGLTWWILGRQLTPMLVAARILDNHSDTNQPMKPLPVSNPDEIGRLIGGFNHLLENLTHRDEEIRRSRDELEIRVQARTDELQKALANVKMLSGLIPICSSCKMIRDDKGYWNQIESYIKDHSEAQFSHGICPDCARKLYPKFFNDDGTGII
jgi:C4-dicarboxylate-specific signal transduction histidine kinase